MSATSNLTATILILMFGCSLALLEVVRAEPQDSSEPATSKPMNNRTLKLPSDARHTLWIPGDYQLRGNTVDVLFDFHGAPRIVCEGARLAGLHCVVISVKYSGLSSVYRVPFSEDRQLLATILDEALAALRAEPDFPHDLRWGRLAITSFSAGFGAVREVLKTQDYFDQIDGIFMVDSLYCGYVGDGTDDIQEGVVHPGLMKDFLRFAQASATGEKVMIVTHCMEPTPGYASTRETADYLLDKLDLRAEPVEIVVELPDEANVESGALRLYRQAARKGFSLYGSPGMGETDHVEHLKHMAYWLPGLPLAKRDGRFKEPASQ